MIPFHTSSATGLGHDRPLWLAAHTQHGEEEAIGAAHVGLAQLQPGLCTVILPAHGSRCVAVAGMLQSKHQLRVLLWPPSSQQQVLQQQQEEMGLGSREGAASAVSHDVLLVAKAEILPLLYR